ncbi:MAG: hypothetical protein JSV86_20985 [Gemmatimonadota bacterium]|nr:MAG: hypothetical protein JSV86_20985 [Gemmatimonadota bacterium]
MHVPALLTTIVLLVLISGCRGAAERDAPGGEQAQGALNVELRDELVRMGQEDQRDRQQMMAIAAARDTAAMRRLWEADSARSARIAEVIEAHGWPGLSLVGEAGADAAFLVVQHSPSTEFQKQVLPLLTEAAESGEASKEQMALLTDRVLVSEGQPQRYGTQAKIVDGRVVLDPIQDEPNVDARRAEIGLMPLAEYVALLERIYLAPAEEEADAPQSKQ